MVPTPVSGPIDAKMVVSPQAVPSMNSATEAQPKTWQQTKSERTRTTILDAAIECFYELGYSNTTTENIAQKAGVSRGAMLHHFPTRADLMKAAVEHLHQIRLSRFLEEESRIQEGADHTRVEEGIEAYWRQLNTREFVVFHELKVAARTDAELAAALKPTLEDYARAWGRAASQMFPDLAQSKAFARTVFMTQYLFEGMAISGLIDGARVPEEMLLDWLKQELRRSYKDVRSVKRRAGRETTGG
jgi:AcrR family transcriptional regulator